MEIFASAFLVSVELSSSSEETDALLSPTQAVIFGSRRMGWIFVWLVTCQEAVQPQQYQVVDTPSHQKLP